MESAAHVTARQFAGAQQLPPNCKCGTAFTGTDPRGEMHPVMEGQAMVFRCTKCAAGHRGPLTAEQLVPRPAQLAAEASAAVEPTDEPAAEPDAP